MKKLLFSFFALLLLSSTTPIFADATRIYCKMEYSWWTKDGARVGIILDSEGPSAMTLVNGSSDTWYADVNLSKKTSITFRRIGPNNTDNWGAETTAQSISDNNVGTTNDFFTITSSSDTWSGSSNYCAGTWSTYTFEPPTIYLKGGFNSWGDGDVFTDNDGTTATIEKYLSEGSYGFKIVVGNDWRSNYTTIARTNSGTEYDFSGNPNDATIQADIDGNYTFTYNYFSQTLKVDFPALPEYSVDFDGLDATILKGSTINFAATSSGVANPGYRYYVKPTDGSYGAAVTSYTFSTAGSFVVKVEALANNTGDPVASKEKNVTVYETYTFTNGTTIYVDFTAMTEGAKGVNYPANSNVGLDYDANGAGTTKTVTFTADVEWSTLDDFIKTEKNGWAGLKFSTPAAGQNIAKVATDGTTFHWDTYSGETPEPTPATIQLHSNITNPSWASSANFVVADGNATASLTIENVSKGSYEFGVKVDGTWRSNGTSFTRTDDGTAKEIVAGSGNCTFTADVDGDYTFTWTYADNTLKVDYPELPEYSVDFNGLDATILKGSTINFAATSSGVANPGYRYYVKPTDGSYGAAVTSYTFSTAGSFVVKVEALANNTGDPVASKEKNVTVYETYTFTNGTTIYVDFTAMTEGAKGVNYPFANSNVGLDYDANGAGTTKTVTFTADVEWSTLDDFIKTEKNGWAGLKFSTPAAGQNIAKVAADGASYTWMKMLAVEFSDVEDNYLKNASVTLAATSNLTNVTYAYQVKIGDGEYATASNPYTFAATGTYTFKVTATGDEGSKEATKVVEVYEPLTLYFVNKEGWDNIHAYAYGANSVKNHDWPGEPMMDEQVTTAGHVYAVYSIVLPQDRYTTAIFNNSGSGDGNQTADMAIDNAKPYYYDGKWYATLAECDPAATEPDEPEEPELLTYQRNVTVGNYGTICLPYDATTITGATLYSIACKAEGGNGIVIEQADNLQKGVPYFFLASASTLVVEYESGQSFTSAENHLYEANGLVGFIHDGEVYTIPTGESNYILYQNGLYLVNSTATIASNRAYIDWTRVPEVAPASGAPRRSIGIYQSPTNVDDMLNNDAQAAKIIRNGILFIQRNGHTYNTIGQIVK